MVIEKTAFTPDYAQHHPGEFLNDILEERGIKKVDFAERCGRPTKTISEIISGKTSITPETALQFERVLGTNASVWLQLESTYQLQIARARDTHSFVSAADWAAEFPVKEMIKKGYDLLAEPKDAAVENLLRFFGVSSVSAWEKFCLQRVTDANFKQARTSSVNSFAVAAWIRQTELSANQAHSTSYSEAGFRAALPEIRSLTKTKWPDFQSELARICENVGVTLALVPDLKKTGLRGAAYWATKDKPVIALSDRLGYVENFWFAFFHETCHILNHSKKALFLEPDTKPALKNDIEVEADEFAADILISKTHIDLLVEQFGRKSRRLPSATLKSLAKELDISEGLLLARLQHENIVTYATKLNKTLKQRIQFSDC